MRRPRTLATLTSLTAAAVLATGCTAPAESQDSAAATGEEMITVTDQRGVEVTLDGPAQNIASAVIPAPAIIAAVDGDVVVRRAERDGHMRSVRSEQENALVSVLAGDRAQIRSWAVESALELIHGELGCLEE